jgi:hypothetical protein
MPWHPLRSVKATKSALGSLPALPYPPLSPSLILLLRQTCCKCAVGSIWKTLNLEGKWSH